jgi:hypothetical protein
VRQASRVLFLAVTIAACAEGGQSAASSTARLQTLCETTTNMSASICSCVAKKAGDELSEDARAFLVASMDKQDDRAAELRGKLTLEELTRAGMFFANAPASCARAAAEGK